MRLRPGSRRASTGTKRPTPDHCWRRRLTPTAGFVAGQAIRVTAVAARTAGSTRPECQPQPWIAPWRALARDARRREALLSWQVARVHMPGRRNDRRCPRLSAALWGLWLLSTSPPLAVPPAATSVWLRFYALQFSATHTQAPAFPTPGALRHKRNRIRTLRIISGPDARCPCPAGGVTRRHTGTVCLYITYTR
jgi:hypothetical protein